MAHRPADEVPDRFAVPDRSTDRRDRGTSNRQGVGIEEARVGLPQDGAGPSPHHHVDAAVARQGEQTGRRTGAAVGMDDQEALVAHVAAEVFQSPPEPRHRRLPGEHLNMAVMPPSRHRCRKRSHRLRGPRRRIQQDPPAAPCGARHTGHRQLGRRSRHDDVGGSEEIGGHAIVAGGGHHDPAAQGIRAIPEQRFVDRQAFRQIRTGDDHVGRAVPGRHALDHPRHEALQTPGAQRRRGDGHPAPGRRRWRTVRLGLSGGVARRQAPVVDQAEGLRRYVGEEEVGRRHESRQAPQSPAQASEQPAVLPSHTARRSWARPEPRATPRGTSRKSGSNHARSTVTSEP